MENARRESGYEQVKEPILKKEPGFMAGDTRIRGNAMRELNGV